METAIEKLRAEFMSMEELCIFLGIATKRCQDLISLHKKDNQFMPAYKASAGTYYFKYEDVNQDGIPDNLEQPVMFSHTVEGTYSSFFTGSPTTDTMLLPENITYITSYGDEDIEITVNDTRLTFANGLSEPSGSPAMPGDDTLIRNHVTFDTQPNDSDTIRVTSYTYVYFSRELTTDPWVAQPLSDGIRKSWAIDATQAPVDRRYERYPGRYPLNFAWFHTTPNLSLVDPAASNIIDIFIITRGYYDGYIRWLENKTNIQPDEPTPLDLRTAYAELLNNKMISDTVILHSGGLKILFGSRAIPELRTTFKIVRPEQSSLTDNEVKVRVVESIRKFFDIEQWDFGETFFFTELAATIHAELGPEIDSVVLVPTYSQNQFGDMFQVQSRENEMFIPDISTSNIEIVQSYTPENIRQYD